jgi:hypothetical protein
VFLDGLTNNGALSMTKEAFLTRSEISHHDGLSSTFKRSTHRQSRKTWPLRRRKGNILFFRSETTTIFFASRDESLEEPDNLAEPGVLAQQLVEDLGAAAD